MKTSGVTREMQMLAGGLHQNEASSVCNGSKANRPLNDRHGWKADIACGTTGLADRRAVGLDIASCGMSELFELVNLRSAPVLSLLGATGDFSLVDSDECSVTTSRFVISIQRERPNNAVSSTIVPRSALPEFDDLCDTRLMSRFFPALDYAEHQSGSSLAEGVQRELDNVLCVLREVLKLDKAQQRDMFYFMKGYTHGYTSRFT